MLWSLLVFVCLTWFLAPHKIKTNRAKYNSRIFLFVLSNPKMENIVTHICKDLTDNRLKCYPGDLTYLSSYPASWSLPARTWKGNTYLSWCARGSAACVWARVQLHYLRSDCCGKKQLWEAFWNSFLVWSKRCILSHLFTLVFAWCKLWAWLWIFPWWLASCLAFRLPALQGLVRQSLGGRLAPGAVTQPVLHLFSYCATLPMLK